MTITAKYAATCATCRQPIRAGQQIEWAKGSPARHTSCSSAAPAAPAAPAPAATGKCACGAPTKAGYSRCYACYQRSNPNRKCGTCGGSVGTRGRYGQYSGGTCQCCHPNCQCYACRE